jgi:D-tagatose-bisphosphate aldolase class II non-catalytic subunit
MNRENVFEKPMICVCTANWDILDATLAYTKTLKHARICIEATSNQSNQDGGYSGLRPNEFLASLESRAAALGVDLSQVMTGGDHLGPLPWRAEQAETAMKKARELVVSYAEAGFDKLHIDTSPSCADDPDVLPSERIAERAAMLIEAAEGAARKRAPWYMIGTEVPPAGGAPSHVRPCLTSPSEVQADYSGQIQALRDLKLGSVQDRILGVVCGTGAEYGTDGLYYPEANVLPSAPHRALPFKLEAHSTDFQPVEVLRDLIRSGFWFLKVGPELTFGVRAALTILECLEASLVPFARRSRLETTLARALERAPSAWNQYYSEDTDVSEIVHSILDRVRYVWRDPAVERAIETLRSNLDRVHCPRALAEVYLGRDAGAYLGGSDTRRVHVDAFLSAQVHRVLGRYEMASRDGIGA